MTRPTAGRLSAGKSPGNPAKRTGIRVGVSRRETRRCQHTHEKVPRSRHGGPGDTASHPPGRPRNKQQEPKPGTERVSPRCGEAGTSHAARPVRTRIPAAPLLEAVPPLGTRLGRGQGDRDPDRRLCGSLRREVRGRLLRADPGRGGRQSSAAAEGAAAEGAAVTATVRAALADAVRSTKPDPGGRARQCRWREGPGTGASPGTEAEGGDRGQMGAPGNPASIGAGWRWWPHRAKGPFGGGRRGKGSNTW